MYGNGTAVLCAEPVIENETFAVMWRDEFIHSNPPRLSQMMRVYEQYGGAVISAVRIQNKEDLIFTILRQQHPGIGGEIWLSEVIAELIKTRYPVYACEIEQGRYYDTGNKLEYLKTVIELALQHPDIQREFKAFLKALPLD